MSVVIKKQEYEKATEGLHNLIVSKVEDLGVLDSKNGPKQFVRIVSTVLDQKDKEGKAIEVFQRFSASLGAKSFLTKFLGQLGYTNVGTEFDIEELVGVKYQAVIEHTEKDGQTYANVASVIKQKKTTSTEV
jgi:hypothetical protein